MHRAAVKHNPPRFCPTFRRAACLLALSVGLAAWSARADDDDDKSPPAEASRALAPAGTLVPDQATGRPAVGSLPLNFVRSPDRTGPDGRGRYLVAVNSGFGVQFDAHTNRAQQSLAVIDLNALPAPAVVQNVYFPTPQSACVGAAFSPLAPDGTATLHVSGGFENRVWRFRFTPGAPSPLFPASPGPDSKATAPFTDLAPLATVPISRRYNAGKAAVYPLGLAWDAGRLFTANNLGDSLGCLRDPDDDHSPLARADLRRTPDDAPYPYAVAVVGEKGVRLALERRRRGGRRVAGARSRRRRRRSSRWAAIPTRSWPTPRATGSSWRTPTTTASRSSTPPPTARSSGSACACATTRARVSAPRVSRSARTAARSLWPRPAPTPSQSSASATGHAGRNPPLGRNPPPAVSRG